MMNKGTVAAALLICIGSSAAWSYDFTEGDLYSIDLTGFGAGGMTQTFDVMSSGNVPATSVYTNNGSAVAGSEATTLVGQTLAFSDVGSAIFGTLNNGNVPLTVSQSLGYNDTWRLNVSYNVGGVATFVDCIVGAPALCDGSLTTFAPVAVNPAKQLIGPTDALVPLYNTDGSGYFNLYFDNLGNGLGNDVQVARFDLVQVNIDGPNVVFYTEQNYDWFAGGNSFVENFFNHTASGKTFYQLWLEGIDPGVVLRADFNVDPNYLPRCVDPACATLTRSTDLNITTVVKVPAPMTPALFGLGMLVMAWSRKHFKSA